MQFLVTGASGHLGSYVTKRLVECGEEVSILVREQSDLWRLSDILHRLHIYYADLADVASVGGAIAAAAPDIILHLAWSGVTIDCRNDPAQITRNITGSLKLFEIAHAVGCRCWIGIGSQAEYGPYAIPLTEDLPTKPNTVYGVSKLCVGLLIEKLCQLAGMRFVWLRLLATYGPKDNERHLIPSVIKQLLAGKVPALTLGEQKWDYLYVEDAAEAIHLVAVKPEVSGVYNLGSGEAYTVRSIIERIRDMVDISLPLGFGEVPYQPDQVMHLEADISKLQAAIEWSPQITLDEGLRCTVDWHRATTSK